MTKEEDRKLVIAACLEVMRDCHDHIIRMEAYDVLVKCLPVALKPERWAMSGWERRDYMPGRLSN